MNPLRIVRGSALLALLLAAVLVYAEPRPVASFAPDLAIIKGVGMVAVNPLVDLCGLQMTLQGQTLTVTRGRKSFTCTLGQTAATQNGRPVTLKLAPFKRAAAIYVPVRPLIEALGGTLTVTRPAHPRFPAEQCALLSLPGLAPPLSLLMETSDDRLDDRKAEVYLVNSDGSGKQMLATGDDPCFTPDGRQILFLASPQEGEEGRRTSMP